MSVVLITICTSFFENVSCMNMMHDEGLAGTLFTVSGI